MSAELFTDADWMGLEDIDQQEQALETVEQAGWQMRLLASDTRKLKELTDMMDAEIGRLIARRAELTDGLSARIDQRISALEQFHRSINYGREDKPVVDEDGKVVTPAIEKSIPTPYGTLKSTAGRRKLETGKAEDLFIQAPWLTEPTVKAKAIADAVDLGELIVHEDGRLMIAQGDSKGEFLDGFKYTTGDRSYSISLNK